MFDNNPSLGCIVDDVDPIGEPLRRDKQQGTLATELVVNDQQISGKEVRAAHEAWTNALVSISQTYKNEGPEAAEQLAGDVIDSAYAYQLGAVAFKPTWAYGDTTFRRTRNGAVSYFVGGNKKFDDPGFALGNKPDPETGERSP